MPAAGMILAIPAKPVRYLSGGRLYHSICAITGENQTYRSRWRRRGAPASMAGCRSRRKAHGLSFRDLVEFGGEGDAWFIEITPLA
jgi:hypothetical protein